jgi:hypothetical protein
VASSRWDHRRRGNRDKRELTAVRKRVDQALQADDEDACVTVITGLALPEVFPAYGISPTTRPRPYLELAEESRPRVAFFERPEAVIAVEDIGLQGNRRAVLELLSAKGTAGTAFWNCRGMRRVTLARGGSVIYSETADYIDRIKDPELRPFFAGLRFGGVDDAMRAIVVVERFTGVHIDGTAPDEEEYLAYPVSPIPD